MANSIHTNELHEISLQKEERDGIIKKENYFKKGQWSSEEDEILAAYVTMHGEGNWNAVERNSGLARCGKSCRLRWINHLRPDLKKGKFSKEEEDKIIELHAALGNKWSKIASQVTGRTDNEIKNYWNTRKRKHGRAGLPLYPPDITNQQTPIGSSLNNNGFGDHMSAQEHKFHVPPILEFIGNFNAPPPPPPPLHDDKTIERNMIEHFSDPSPQLLSMVHPPQLEFTSIEIIHNNLDNDIIHDHVLTPDTGLIWSNNVAPTQQVYRDQFHAHSSDNVSTSEGMRSIYDDKFSSIPSIDELCAIVDSAEANGYLESMFSEPNSVQANGYLESVLCQPNTQLQGPTSTSAANLKENNNVLPKLDLTGNIGTCTDNKEIDNYHQSAHDGQVTSSVDKQFGDIQFFP